MCNQYTLTTVLDKVCEKAKSVFGDSLVAVKLYGSYARGDFDEESDIDVMIIADISPDERYNLKAALSEYIYDLDLEYNVLLSVFIQDNATYERYKASYPFFKNVEKEGVDLVA